MLAAESGTLTATFTPVDIAELIVDVIHQIKYHQVSEGIKIINLNSHQPIDLKTDAVLLKRVLLNMLKNAVEASEKGMEVSVGTNNHESHLEIWVKNETLIPREVQLQIFQRSFSTKDQARGIGTYSIKMFTEQYLKGKVSFVSTEDTKTVFSVFLPKN